jgi:hypothetical protein
MAGISEYCSRVPGRLYVDGLASQVLATYQPDGVMVLRDLPGEFPSVLTFQKDRVLIGEEAKQTLDAPEQLLFLKSSGLGIRVQWLVLSTVKPNCQTENGQPGLLSVERSSCHPRLKEGYHPMPESSTCRTHKAA